MARQRASRPLDDASNSSSRKPATSVDAVDGLSITAGRTPIRIIDHAGVKQVLAPGDTAGFRPTPISGVEQGQTEIPGFRAPPPSSILWLEIARAHGAKAKDVKAKKNDTGTTVILDVSGLRRNAARWGRPTILIGGTSEEERGRWVMLVDRAEYSLKGQARLLVVGMGHGIAVDPASIFSSLARSSAFRRREGHDEGESRHGK